MGGSGAYDFKPMLRSLRNELKPIMKNALIQGGGALGSMSGIPSGRNFGSEVGRRISRLIGSGDYQVNEVSVNNLIKPGKATPSMSFGGDSLSIRVRHREFLGDILTGGVAGVFTNNVFPINAGLRTSFPYLSQIAGNFEEYCFNGLVFEFISTASPYSATSALGSVIAATEYNSSMPTYTSKFSMENSSMAVSTRIDKNLMYGIECAANSNVQNCYYVRHGTSTLPITTTDMGIFQLATSPGAAFPTNSVVGELWVTYDVELKRPYLELNRVGSFQSARSTAINASPLGTASLASATSGSLSNTLFTATTIVIPNQIVGDTVFIALQWQAGTAAAYVPCTYAVANGSVLGTGTSPIFGVADGISNAPSAAVATSTAVTENFYVQCTNSGNVTITVTATGLPTVATQISINGVSVGNYPVPSSIL